MAVSEQEFQQLKRDLDEAVKKLDKVHNVLFGIANDTRFQAKVRAQVIDEKEHTTNKPTIISKSGKRYNVQTV